MLSIIIDSREPDTIKNLTFNDAMTAVSMLDAGDLQILAEDGNLLVIERKTPDDLLGSIRDGRLFEQAVRMKQLSPWVYLVITGPLQPGPDGKLVTSRSTLWDFDAVWGALETVEELGVIVTFCRNELEYPAKVQKLANRDRSEVKAGAVRSGGFLSPGETILSSLPGIGLDRAMMLLECNTPARALEFLTRFDLGGIPGIGNKIKSNVKRALGLKEDENLLVVNDLNKEFLEG